MHKKVVSFYGYGSDMDATRKDAEAYANVLDEVISITFSDKSKFHQHPYSFIIFGYTRGIEYVDYAGNPVGEKDSYLFEVPVDQGKILVYKEEHVDALLEYLGKIRTASSKSDLLEKGFWLSARCVGGRDCEKRDCPSEYCRKASTGGGTYCACLPYNP
jgi:hypothetical protein